MTVPPLTADTVLRRAAGTAEVEHNTGVVVLLLDSPDCRPFELTGGGVGIWRSLGRGPRSARGLVEEIAAGHEVDASVIAPEVEAFLEDLLRAGLVENEAARS
ncbi:hypothetical protein B7R22_02900 [Subtercola boreus]|uniref:PqqD family protein n=1 Tax=Subtercola boreus TaxID=120213 RepID=A0A3E0W3A2_9MICO|nr:PqqD family protein [Subtercola boreus]RFA16451.1 hypothetical protein B7R22_02900 [Subtercola boreus]